MDNLQGSVSLLLKNIGQLDSLYRHYGNPTKVTGGIPFPHPPSLSHLTKPLHTKPFQLINNVIILLFSCILVINKTVSHSTCVVVLA